MGMGVWGVGCRNVVTWPRGNSLGSFIVTIDTEGDDIWNGPREITTRNALYLPRFQQLCECFGLKPTYLVNYEMAVSPAFVEFGRDVQARGKGEIGMHLHAWNSPPIAALTGDDNRHKPFLIEYPADALRAKVDFMTKLLQDVFGTPITSHRAGRWAMNEHYARTLIEYGYLTDCSVTPYVDWRGTLGNPVAAGGSDYRDFPTEPYFIDPEDIGRPGNSPLLEVPMTVSKRCPPALRPLVRAILSRPGLPRHVVSRMLRNQWLRPNGYNRSAMIAQVEEAAAAGASHVEFMLHSSEFMPAGSPTFPDARSVERLYADLEALFERASALFSGATLGEFRHAFGPAPRIAVQPEAVPAGGNVVIDGLRS
jgi:hypothetical protein